MADTVEMKTLTIGGVTFEVTDETARKAGIKSIQRTSGNGSPGTTDTYTITMIGGNTQTFTVYNGKDGNPGSPGSPGSPGEDGVGIESIKQTTTSTEDGGNNVFTVTLDNGVTATFTVKNGSKGSPGSNGNDGVSPTVAVSSITGGHRVTITDKDGAKPFDVMDGAKGEPGLRGFGVLKVATAPATYTTVTNGVTPIKRMALSTIKAEAGVNEVLARDVIAYNHYQYHVYYVDSTYAYMDSYIWLGGPAGEDGVSPTVETKQITGGHSVTITDANGPKTFVVKDGEKGDPGEQGEAPVFESITCETDNSYVGQPHVDVVAGGLPLSPTLHFIFKGIKGEPGETGESGNGAQGDWSVNNEKSANFIKGRTHWKEEYGVDGVVIAETSVAFTSNIKTVTGAMSDGIQVGGLYVVSWNGTDYECVGKSGSDGNYIGNGSFMNAGNMTFEDTGEPFCVLLFGGTYYQLWKADTTAETVTVKVVGKKETVWHKLDSRFLNEALQFGTETKVILPETTSEVIAEMEGAPIFDVLSVEAGKTYTVMWNGTEYVCTAQATPSGSDISGAILGNFGAITGGALTEEPFVIMCFDADTAAAMGIGGLAAPLDGSASVTLSITGETVEKMNAKFLPNYLPHIETGSAILPEMTGEVDPDAGGIVFSDVLDVKANSTYIVKYNGAEYTSTAQSYSPAEGVSAVVIGNLGAATGGVSTGEPFAILCFNAAMAAAQGMGGAIIPVDGSASATVSIHNAIVHPLLPHYLPRLIVNITMDDNTTNTTGVADKTLGEILAAAQAGYDVSCRVTISGFFVPSDSMTFLIPLTNFMTSETDVGVYFNGFNTGGLWFVSMKSDDRSSTAVQINRQILG